MNYSTERRQTATKQSHKIGLISVGNAATKVYGDMISRLTKETLGEDYTLNLEESHINAALIKVMSSASDWDGLAGILLKTIKRLKSTGAQAVAINSFALHRVVPMIVDQSPLPLISIVDCVAAAIKRNPQLKRVGLLGDHVLVHSESLVDRLESLSESTIVIPPLEDQESIDRAIASLSHDVVDDTALNAVADAIQHMREKNRISGVILGAAELASFQALCVRSLDFEELPFLNATSLHAEAIVNYCLT